MRSGGGSNNIYVGLFKNEKIDDIYKTARKTTSMVWDYPNKSKKKLLARLPQYSDFLFSDS
jgi:uncharacterized membrane protein YoaT (DUF817 family)